MVVATDSLGRLMNRWLPSVIYGSVDGLID